MRRFWMLTGLTLASCGEPYAPDVSDQPTPQLTLPDYSLSADPLLLTDRQSIQYSGSVIVWGESPDPAAVEAVMNAAIDMRYRKADLKAFTEANIKPLRHRLPAMRAELLAMEIEADSNKEDLETVALYARQWTDTTFATWRADHFLTADELAAGREVLNAYCEAKIWELASESTFVHHEYRSVPTPFQVCQNYYEAGDYFDPATPACADAAAGRSYFTCLWTQGIMKTRFFKGRYTPEQVAKILAWVTPEAPGATPYLQQLLQDADQELLVRIGIMDQRRSMPLGRDRYLFRPVTGTPRAEPDMLLAHASPQMVIRAAEYGPSADTPAALSMFAKGEETSERYAVLTSFYKDLQTLGERNIGTPSVNDFKFHDQLGTKAESANYEYAKTRDSLKFIFDNRSPYYKELIAQLTDDIVTAESTLQTYETLSATNYLEPLAQSMELSAEAAAMEGVSVGLWISSLLHIEHIGQTTKVTFHLDSQKGSSASACLTRDTFQATSCEGQNATLTRDADSGALELAIPLANPDAFGFQLQQDDVATPAEPFSHIDPDVITDTEMRLTLYPNHVDHSLLYYSGKMTIEDKGQTIYEGAVTLTEDI